MIGDATVSGEGNAPGTVCMKFRNLGTDMEYMDDLRNGRQQMLLRDDNVMCIEFDNPDLSTYSYEHSIHGYQYGYLSEFKSGQEELSFCYGLNRHRIHWLQSSSYEPFFYTIHSFTKP